jgi:hypothetical protein
MKYAFASHGWIAFMHGLVVERLERLRHEAPDVGWSICEVFTDPPPALSPAGAPLAWHCIVRGGELLSFGASVRDDVEFKVVADYDSIVPLGRYDTRGEPERAAELSRMSAALVAAGRMQVTGDRSGRDPRIGGFHDLIAQVTA